jgi:hypothetical protein
MISQKEFTPIHSVFFFALLMILTACSTLPGTLEISLLPEPQANLQIMYMEELSPVLESILFGSIDERRELVSYTTVACTNADGLGGPPKCKPGQVEGTLVEVLPILSGEGTYSSPDEIESALDFVVMGLYAIYRVPDDAFKADYWPAGEYGLIFTREMNAVPFPLTVFVEDGRIVRLHHHFGTEPENLINQLPVEAILLTPNEAKEWVAEHTPDEPPSAGLDNGTVTGSVCFPSESIPELTLFFQEVGRGDLSYQNHPQEQSSYSINLSPGTYLAFAYPVNSGDEDIGGSYSQAVNCGLGVECTDHSPVLFEVKPGEEISGVDICDWYSPGDVPANPESDQNTDGPKPTGGISGKICYPSEFIPEMTAFFQEISTQQITELPIAENQASYTFLLPPGKYVAYTYLNSGAALGGSYSNAVLCGLSTGCSDHSLVQFDVNPGDTLSAIDICDWYAPEAIPPDPRAALAPLSSMVYRTKEGDYFWIEANGNSDFIHNGSNLAIPYSGPYGVYSDNNDLLALDLFTGESYQLTDTPNLIETSYHFDVGLPEQILFTAIPIGEEIGPGYTGGLYIINMDGTNQRTIDSEHNAVNFAASPDGQLIAYGAGETAFLYSWETGVEIFNPRDYGMDSPKGQIITSPSWSPAGDKLAWFASGFFDDLAVQGFGIFDLFENTFRLIHPFQALGMDITPPAAEWSPDDVWLAISVFDQEPARSGVWLVNMLNPQQEIFMGTGSSNPVFGPWREDRKILTYFKFDQTQGESRTWIYDLVSGQHQLTPLPPEAQVIAWR